MEEDVVLRRFGTPLPELDEDEIPSKKPINVEDQIVTDVNGRRRFHGAFTGGFSAGFWNTVGSLEGWKPTEFKSSRAEKAEKKMQKPEDFMDDEDLGEFGIAPQQIQTTDKFTNENSGKRKHEKFNDGPIPGVPVLKQLLQPAKETIAIKLLKQMGWKEGQGVGARITRKEKDFVRKHNQKEMYLMEKYGCEIEKSQANSEEEDSADDYSDSEILFAPDDYDVVINSIKDNYFGLGYSGLSREGVLKNQFNLFDQFEVVDRNNKKFSISGHAFGVGALEEEDEDIYAKDDLTRYDFTLENKASSSKKAIKAPEKGILDGFTKSTKSPFFIKEIFKVDMPAGFIPRNWAQRKSRFEPLDPTITQTVQSTTIQKTKNLGRHDLKPVDRGILLNEDTRRKGTLQFIKSEILNPDQAQDVVEIQRKALKITENLPSSSGVFQPFQLDAAKQSRYEKFLEFIETPEMTLDEFLKSIQPITFNNWDREMERKEFIHAKKLYKPLRGLMLDRFISESEAIKQTEIESTVKKQVAGQEITVKRTKCMWKPCAILCKRFNINNPYGEYVEKEDPRKKPKFSIFNYIEPNLNDKKDFVAPIIIPKKEVEETEPAKTVRDVPLPPTPPQPPIVQIVQRPPVPPTPKPSQPSTSKPIPVPKSSDPKINSLIMRVQETTHVHPSNKKDLFKCIFESSDEEDDNGGDGKPTTSNSVPKVNITEILRTSANEINKLRNNSPPRGIFANLFTPKNVLKEPPEQQVNVKPSEIKKTPIDDATPTPPKQSEGPKIKFRTREERIAEDDMDNEDETFGPQIPQRLAKSSDTGESSKKMSAPGIGDGQKDLKQNLNQPTETAKIKFRSREEREADEEAEKIKFGLREQRQEPEETTTKDDNMFGPKLPERCFVKPGESRRSAAAFMESVPLSKPTEEWIEKDKLKHKKKSKDKDKEKQKKKKHKKEKKKRK